MAAIAHSQSAQFIAGGGFQTQSPTPTELADMDKAIAVADKETNTFLNALQAAIDKGLLKC